MLGSGDLWQQAGHRQSPQLSVVATISHRSGQLTPLRFEIFRQVDGVICLCSQNADLPWMTLPKPCARHVRGLLDMAGSLLPGCPTLS